MDELHQTLADEIRRQAERRKIALSHVADRAGVSRAHFWDVLAGRKSPTLTWLGKIATALDVRPIELLRAQILIFCAGMHPTHIEYSH